MNHLPEWPMSYQVRALLHRSSLATKTLQRLIDVLRPTMNQSRKGEGLSNSGTAA